ncbi:hypothetical protein BGX34_001039, partial [Mortierella sp. NVP85]
MSNEVYRKYFGYEQQPEQGERVNLWGGFYTKKSSNAPTVPAIPALIPNETPAFEAEEEDNTGSLDVTLSHEKINEILESLREKVKKLEEDRTLDLELEELVDVQPYQDRNRHSERQWTTVVVAMSNCEGANVKYSGLEVEYVDLSSFTRRKEDKASAGVPSTEAHRHIVRGTAVPKFTIDAMQSPVFPQEKSKPAIPISRLAWSKGGTFLAALALSDDAIYITVWDMKHWEPSKAKQTSTLHEKSAVAIIGVPKYSLKDRSIGLAISSDGSQVAVYQEPIVGEWTDGSELGVGTFSFCLLTLSNQESTDHVALNMTTTSELSAQGTHSGSNPSRNNHSVTTEPPLDGPKTKTHRSYKNVGVPHSKLNNLTGYGAFLTEAKRDWNMDNFSAVQLVHEDVKDGIIGRSHNGEIQPLDFSRQSRTPCALFVACNGMYIDVFKIKSGHDWENTHSISLTDLTPTISRRITCKMMMDAISSNTFIWLEDGGVCCMLWNLGNGSNISYISGPKNTEHPENARLGSSNFRGNSTMSISPDESMVALANVDGILTTFYSSTGISISSRKFQGQIECVAFNGQDNRLFVITRDSITLELHSWILDPLDLASGIPVNQVPVPVIGRTVLAFFRDKDFKNEGLVCEANGSKIHCYVTHEPIEASKSKAMVHPTDTFYPRKDDKKYETKNDKGTVTNDDKAPKTEDGHEPGTKDIEKLGTKDDHEPETKDFKKPETKDDQEPETKDVEQDITGDKQPEITDGDRPEGKDEHKDRPQEEAMGRLKEDKRYEVRTATEMTMSRDEDGSMDWIISVEVVERDLDDRNEKVIFSFVPEPWIHVSASENHKPKDLQKVYFLPGGKRFVVVGIQTLQIWSLPTIGNDNFKLVFIWSRPRVSTDLNDSDGNGVAHQKEPDDLNSAQVAGKGKPDTNEDTDQGGSSGNIGMVTSPEKPVRKPIETEPVGNFYHRIETADIYRYQHIEEAEAHIWMKEGSGKDIVNIPSEQSGDFYTEFLNCARSIHLLAASYVYSVQESKKFPKNLDKSMLSFKEHAEAIARFTRRHINRLLSRKHFYPPQLIEASTPSHPTPSHPTSEVSQREPNVQRPSLITQKSTAGRSTPALLDQFPAVSNSGSISFPKILKALECTPSASPKLLEESDDLPKTLISRSEDLRKGVQKFLSSRNEGASLGDIFTTLTLLLDQDDLKGANHVFIEGLFKTEGHEWTPHPSMALNPIERVIDIKNEQLLNVMIDYCIKNAKERHPGYLTPVIQCLSKLSKSYPEIMGNLFRRASHIPAHNSQYVTSHAIVANLRFSDWIHFLARFFTLGIFHRRLLGFTKSSDINLYTKPVFSLQSQLPCYSHVGFWKVLDFAFDLVPGRRNVGFPKRKNTEQTQPATENRWGKIYVSPFQFKPIRRNGRLTRSFLAEIAGKDFFDSPAVRASLRFKWNNSGLYFWSLHFVAVLVFFILVLAITGRQIHVSRLPAEGEPTAAEIADRYLPGWQPVLILTIVIGMLLIIYEIWQMVFSTKKYFLSLFNLSDLTAYFAPVIGCFIFMNDKPEVRADTGIDGGPSQISIMAFGILLLYLNI